MESDIASLQHKECSQCKWWQKGFSRWYMHGGERYWDELVLIGCYPYHCLPGFPVTDVASPELVILSWYIPTLPPIFISMTPLPLLSFASLFGPPLVLYPLVHLLSLSPLSPLNFPLPSPMLPTQYPTLYLCLSPSPAAVDMASIMKAVVM